MPRLITKEIERKLLERGTCNDFQTSDQVIVKYHVPGMDGGFYVMEGSKQRDSDWLFWGLGDAGETKFDFVWLSTLKKITQKTGFGFSRDDAYKGTYLDLCDMEEKVC